MANDRDKPNLATPPAERTSSDDPMNGTRIVYALFAACAGLVVVDPFIHKHGPFAIEHVWGFYGIVGFLACVGLVVGAKLVRAALMRPEDYYDE